MSEPGYARPDGELRARRLRLRSLLRRYIVAVLAVAAVLLIKLSVDPFIEEESPFLLFFAAVMISAWQGGLGPGLFATVSAALISDYFFLSPIYSLAGHTVSQNLRVGMFVLEGGLISLLNAARRSARDAASRSEESLSTTLKSIGEAVVATDSKGRVTFMNPIAEAMTGWREDDATGKELTDVFRIVNEETRREMESLAARIIREGATVGLASYTRLIAKDGRMTPVDSSGAPIRDAAGNVAGAVLVFHDVTERKRAEEEHARLYQQTLEANRAKDEFLATLSHELRTPLTSIIGWTHMMRSERLSPPESLRGLAVIDKNSQLLTRLINDLLDMSAILSGKMSIERAPVRIDIVLNEAVETCRTQAAKRGIVIDIEVARGDDKQSLIVSGDKTRLVQVFWNLLHNAVKFSPDNSRVRVVCESNSAEVRVRVEDTGRGITPDFLPFVFERFRQADGSTTRAYGGLGIGLALVKSFVEAHGGTAVAESGGQARGSCFTITLPLLHPQRVTEPASVGDAPAEFPAPTPIADGKRHVLIVEDARDTLDMLQVVFEARGYQTTLCSTAVEALRVAASLWFDIIVLDIGLPSIDGYELMTRLRKMPHLRDVPAIALTGYAAPKDAESALAAGFNVHLSKPVDLTILAERVDQLIQQNQEVK